MMPATLTVREARARGWTADEAERVLPGGRGRKDCFGLADVVALVPGGTGTVYIQATSWTNHAARRKKALESKILPLLLENGNQFWIWSWVRTRGEERLKVQEICWYPERGVVAHQAYETEVEYDSLA